MRSWRASGAPHAECDRARIAPMADALHGKHGLRAAVPVDGIVAVPRVARGGPRLIWSGLVDLVREAVREVQLPRVDDRAADVHFDVDVGRPAPIPAGVDGLELTVAPRNGPFHPAQNSHRHRGPHTSCG